MKRTFAGVWIALLLVACTVDFASAQPQGGGRRGGMGMGPGGNQGEFISDCLVLNASRSEQVKKVCDEVNAEMRQSMSGDLQNMTPEERRTAFTEMREKTQKALLEKLTPILSADELEAVKPLLGSRGGRTVAEIRALRQIDISDEERGKLQTLVLIYQNTLVSLLPQREPGQPGGQGGQRGGGMTEETRAKMEKARETLLADIQKVLSADQLTAWKTQTEKVQTELESQRPQRGDQPQGERPGRNQRG